MSSMSTTSPTSAWGQTTIGLSPRDITLGDLLSIRPSGLEEGEIWAVLCQSVQALQDLFLSDGVSDKQSIPLVTPLSLKLSSNGRVKFQRSLFHGIGPMTPTYLEEFLAPEYRENKKYNDSEYEKMWIYSLGKTLKCATGASDVALSRLSIQLCRVLSEMTDTQEKIRASLMYLLDIMATYCKNKQQNRPFSHVVMDLYQEALVGLELSADAFCPLRPMPEMIPKAKVPSAPFKKSNAISRPWRLQDPTNFKSTKEIATSMNDLSILERLAHDNTPGKISRPKSLCVTDKQYIQHEKNVLFERMPSLDCGAFSFDVDNNDLGDYAYVTLNTHKQFQNNGRRNKVLKRNPVQRVGSRLYRANPDSKNKLHHNYIGPEFVVKASFPSKRLFTAPCSKSGKNLIVIIMLDGQKLEITCDARSTTAGQLLELIFQEEHIEENFMLGLSALVAGDFVFIPTDTRICKVIRPETTTGSNLTLYLRLRFFLPSLRGIKGNQARHFLYLQLRRSILEHQLPSSFSQIIELNGLALQAEFGNYDDMDHGTREYFLLEHYVPETMTCIMEDEKRLRDELTKAHISKKFIEREKAEEDFIILAQSLPHYGGHFYTATWVLKGNKRREIWLYISAQGIKLFERGKSTSQFGPQLYKTFEWKSIQTLCYTKHYFSIIPNGVAKFGTRLEKYKLKMDHKKSYFAFRLASLHHQFFLKLRTEFSSLQSLSQQFGIPLKDIKNETNSICKTMDTCSRNTLPKNIHAKNSEIKYQSQQRLENLQNNASNYDTEYDYQRKTRSVHDFDRVINDIRVNEDHQNKENEQPKYHSLNSPYVTTGVSNGTEKRRGVKMGTRAFSKITSRAYRSMEAINDQEFLERMSLDSMLYCSSTSLSKASSDGLHKFEGDAYVLDSTLKSVSQHNFLPNFQETINETLLDRLNNMSFTEERMILTVTIDRDTSGCLGLQVTEGSDGNTYIQSVIAGGSADCTRGVKKGDQVIAVNGQSLLGRRYSESLEILKKTGQKVELVVSRAALPPSPIESLVEKHLSDIKEENPNTYDNNATDNGPNISKSSKTQLDRPPSVESHLEKHNIELCHDVSNSNKYINRTPVNRRNISYYSGNMCNNINVEDNDKSTEIGSKVLGKNTEREYHKQARSPTKKPVIVDMIPKKHFDWLRFPYEMDGSKTLPLMRNRLYRLSNDTTTNDNNSISKFIKREELIALPRSLGLSRKWKGPVRYPVTPVKKAPNEEKDEASTSEEEQFFF